MRNAFWSSKPLSACSNWPDVANRLASSFKKGYNRRLGAIFRDCADLDRLLRLIDRQQSEVRRQAVK